MLVFSNNTSISEIILIGFVGNIEITFICLNKLRIIRKHTVEIHIY